MRAIHYYAMSAKPIDLRRLIDVALAERGLTLKRAADCAGIDYQRALQIKNGFRRPRPGEIEALSVAIKELSRDGAA